MPIMTGGQALVRQLKARGIDTIFGLPGVPARLGLRRALRRARPLPRRSIRATSRPRRTWPTAMPAPRAGSACAWSCPGRARSMRRRALSTAYACSSPVLCVTGQIDSRLIGARTRHSPRGQRPDGGDRLRHEVAGPADGARGRPGTRPRGDSPAPQRGRPRPVEIEVPPDVLQATGEVQLVARCLTSGALRRRSRPRRTRRRAGARQGEVARCIYARRRRPSRRRLGRAAQARRAARRAGRHDGQRARRALRPRTRSPSRTSPRPISRPSRTSSSWSAAAFVVGVTRASWQPGEKTLIQLDADAEEIGRN